MISSGFQEKTLPQSIPAQLSSKLTAHDVIVSRTRRNIRPNGSGSDLKPNTGNPVLDFNLNSSNEWMDVETACLHAKLTIPSVNGKVPFPKSSLASIIGGYTLTCKGQALETSTETTDLAVWNALRNRLYHDEGSLANGRSLTAGTWDKLTAGVPSNYLFDTSRMDASNSNIVTIEMAIPLKDIVNTFNLERSYLPVYMIPMLLRMNLNQTGNVFAIDSSDALQDYTLSNIYISADFLQMDASVDEMMREIVMTDKVSFYYPTVNILSESLTQGQAQVNIKTNLNASNLESVFVYFTRNSRATNQLYPYVTSQVWNAKTMKGCKYNLYIDSRNVFSEQIDNAGDAFGELEKACKNDNEKFLVASPIISAKGYIQGDDNVLNASYDFRDTRCQTLAVNLSRQISPNSMSGVNVSLTGGRLFAQVEVEGNTADRVLMFCKSTQELVVSADFLQVIR